MTTFLAIFLGKFSFLRIVKLKRGQNCDIKQSSCFQSDIIFIKRNLSSWVEISYCQDQISSRFCDPWIWFRYSIEPKQSDQTSKIFKLNFSIFLKNFQFEHQNLTNFFVLFVPFFHFWLPKNAISIVKNGKKMQKMTQKWHKSVEKANFRPKSSPKWSFLATQSNWRLRFPIFKKILVHPTFNQVFNFPWATL